MKLGYVLLAVFGLGAAACAQETFHISSYVIIGAEINTTILEQKFYSPIFNENFYFPFHGKIIPPLIVRYITSIAYYITVGQGN